MQFSRGGASGCHGVGGGEGDSEGEYNPLPSRIVRVGIVLSQESAQQQIRAVVRASPDGSNLVPVDLVTTSDPSSLHPLCYFVSLRALRPE